MIQQQQWTKVSLQLTVLQRYVKEDYPWIKRLAVKRLSRIVLVCIFSLKGTVYILNKKCLLTDQDFLVDVYLDMIKRSNFA